MSGGFKEKEREKKAKEKEKEEENKPEGLKSNTGLGSAMCGLCRVMPTDLEKRALDVATNKMAGIGAIRE